MFASWCRSNKGQNCWCVNINPDGGTKPKLHEYFVLHDKRDFESIIKVIGLNIGRLSWIFLVGSI